MIKTFSGFLENLRQSSEIFVNLRKFSENVWQWSCDLWTSFEESSQIFGKWLQLSENCPKRCRQYVYIIKRTLHVSSKIWILCSRGWRTISHSFTVLWLVRYCSCHSNIKFISSRHLVISSIYLNCGERYEDNDWSLKLYATYIKQLWNFFQA